MAENVIGTKMRELRKSEEMTQEVYGLTFGVSGGTVSNWENGKSAPSFEILQEMADYSEVDMEFWCVDDYSEIDVLSDPVIAGDEFSEIDIREPQGEVISIKFADDCTVENLDGIIEICNNRCELSVIVDTVDIPNLIKALEKSLELWG